MSYTTFLIRISVCFILSLLVGLERQYRRRMIGLRTNVLVCLGAFIFVTVSFGIGVNDHARIAAQVVSGIGFLGAGVILRDGSKIKGLNTAATLWCVAAIGVLCSAGMLFEASIGTLFVLISNVILRIVSIKIMDIVKKNNIELCNIRIECNKDLEMDVRSLLCKNVEANRLTLESLEKIDITDDEVRLRVNIITNEISKVESVINILSSNINIKNISWAHFNYKDLNNEDEDDRD